VPQKFPCRVGGRESHFAVTCTSWGTIHQCRCRARLSLAIFHALTRVVLLSPRTLFAIRRAVSRHQRALCTRTSSRLGIADATLIGSVRGGVHAPPPLAIYRDVVTEAEEARLVREADRWLSKQRYQDGHFDNVIVGYRELQKPIRSFSSASQAILERVSSAVFAEETNLLPLHLLDLRADGYISRHVDHIEYSGRYIVGMSLLSESIMTLHREGVGHEGVWLPMRLPRRSLYVLCGEARYEWAHALSRESEWEGEQLPAKGRRLALIWRDAPEAGASASVMTGQRPSRAEGS